MFTTSLSAGLIDDYDDLIECSVGAGQQSAAVTMGELIAVLWEEGPDTYSRQSNLRNLISELKKTLAEAGAEDIILKSRNTISLDCDAVECDYFDFLRHIPYAVNRYRGEYMNQYSWAEITTAEISEKQD